MNNTGYRTDERLGQRKIDVLRQIGLLAQTKGLVKADYSMWPGDGKRRHLYSYTTMMMRPDTFKSFLKELGSVTRFLGEEDRVAIKSVILSHFDAVVDGSWRPE